MCKWRWQVKRAVALSMDCCMAATGIPAYAEEETEIRQLDTQTVDPTGVTTGDLAAQGKFYSDYTSVEEVAKAGNDVHKQMVEEGEVLLKNENNVLPLASDERNVTFLGI